MYLKFLSTSGIVGLIGFLTLPLYMLYQLSKTLLFIPRNRHKNLALTPLAISVLLLILIHGFVISIGQTAHIWLFFAAIAYVCIKNAEGQVALTYAKKFPRSHFNTIRPPRRPVPTLPRLAR